MEPRASGPTRRLPSLCRTLGGSVSCSDRWAPGTSRGQRTPSVQEGTPLPACEARRVQGHLCCRHGVRCFAPRNGLPQPPHPHEGPLGPPHLCLWGCLTLGSHPQAQEAPSGLSVESYQGASVAGSGDPDRPPADARRAPDPRDQCFCPWRPRGPRQNHSWRRGPWSASLGRLGAGRVCSVSE